MVRWRNRYLLESEHPLLGRFKQVGFPVAFSATPCPAQCGQHTEEVLREVAGCSWEETERLPQDGAFYLRASPPAVDRPIQAW